MGNDVGIFDDFVLWLSKYGKYAYATYRYEFSESAVVDFEDEFVVARFTVWNDLSAISEVLDVGSGKFKIDERKEFSSLGELMNIFEKFESFLGNDVL